MKIVTLFLLLFTNSYAGILTQFDPSQSSPTSDWSEINSPYVKVIYPSFLKEQASFIANLIEHYSTVSGLTYGIEKPKKFPLILRDQFSLPNGFVTLGPRRSEWYTSSNITPILGSLNFYQSLAIHEYRHINQFDSMYRSTNKLAYALFGEFGISLAIGLGVPSWFLEGDAVWAETRYTDGGRGRSPRFAARLKAMVLNDEIPTYDEFMGGTYKTNRPNHYVFGYYLVTQATLLYGEDIWGKILDRVTGFSFNPYSLTNSFEAITGIDFERFYKQTMIDLKFAWKDEQFRKSKNKYSQSYYPIIDQEKLYYVKKDLDSFWGLYKFGSAKPIIEIDIKPEISRIDLKNDLLVYTQFLPSPRYAFQSYNDLFSYNIKTKEKKHLIKNQRLYHPQISPKNDRILAIKFAKNNVWGLSIIDLEGKELKFITLEDETISQAVWMSDNKVIAIVQKPDGQKYIKTINLDNNRQLEITPPTRNNINNLSFYYGSLYFEADYRGTVQILKIDVYSGDKAPARCTNETIAAYNPVESFGKLYYVTEAADGKKLKSRNLNCIKIRRSFLFNYNYIAKTPSDNFTETRPVEIVDFKAITSKSYDSASYSETTSGLSPHSWGVVSGRGIEASVTGNNYLNSVGYNLGLGQSTEEEQPYGFFNLSYSKYYPVFNLNLDYRKREDTNSLTNVKSNWTETKYGLSAIIPYKFKKGLYNNYFEFTSGYSQLKYTEDISAKTYELSDDTLNIKSAEFLAYSLKDRRFREIYPSYGFFYNAVYKKAEASQTVSFSSEVFYQNLNIYLPGFFKNNGFKLSAFQEKQSKGFNNYRFSPTNETITSYVLSRGFDYSYVDKYTKGSIEYAAPLWNTDFNLAGWAFLRRIYGKAFFDHTKVELLRFTNNLNSTGFELIFETKIFRLLDIDIGVRNNYKLDPNESSYDVFFTTNAGF